MMMDPSSTEIYLFSFRFSNDASLLNGENLPETSEPELHYTMRDIFRRFSKGKQRRISTVVSNIAGILHAAHDNNVPMTALPNAETKHEICLVSDSPHYIVRVRSIGKFHEFDLTKF